MLKTAPTNIFATIKGQVMWEVLFKMKNTQTIATQLHSCFSMWHLSQLTINLVSSNSRQLFSAKKTSANSIRTKLVTSERSVALGS